jgi:hypothetical protein
MIFLREKTMCNQKEQYVSMHQDEIYRARVCDIYLCLPVGTIGSSFVVETRKTLEKDFFLSFRDCY